MPALRTDEVAEITIQYSCPVPAADRKPIFSPEDAFQLLWPFFQPHQEVQEAFRVLLLDRGNRAKGVYTLSLGGLHGTVADPKLIFAVALRTLSSSIIIAHNHPSGQVRPSNEDIALTSKLKEGAALLDIGLNDHLIICGPDSWYSFAQSGLL